MKCIRGGNLRGVVGRVKDSVAHELVRKGQAVYIPKHEYREKRRKKC